MSSVPHEGGAVRLFARLVAAALLVSGCGIPQIVFLAPPTIDSVTSFPAQVTYAHDILNNTDSFLGYEFYYKFYAPDGAETQFSADSTAILAAGPQQVPGTLTNRGYRRVYTDASGQTPALRIEAADRGDEFAFTVEFPFTSPGPPPTDALLTSSIIAEPMVLRRDQLFLGTAGEKRFRYTDISSNPRDADVPEGLDPLLEPTLRVGFVALAYGIDYVTGSFSSVYSEARVTGQLLEIYYQ